MLHDVRFALRSIRHNPGFAAVAILSLALGIGANSAIFSLADALLFRPLPVSQPSEVVSVLSRTESDFWGSISNPDYRDYRDKNQSFTSLAGMANLSVGMAANPAAAPQLRYGLMVTGNFFSTIGVEPQLGRAIAPREDLVPGRDAVVVLSHDLWRKDFGGDPGIVGRTVRLNGIEFTVIGVTPERFTGMDQFFRPALYVPLAMSGRLGTSTTNVLEDREHRNILVRGRLKPGVSVEQAEAELQVIAKSLQKEHPATNRNQNVVVRTEVRQRIERSPPDAALLAILSGLVALVLLIACANVANLLLGRARARQREIAIRLAIGAGRAALVRQLLTESIVIALAGGAAGILVAYAGVQFLSQIQIPTDLPLILSVQLDSRVLIYALAASLVSAVLFGLVPALQTSRAELVPALKAAEPGGQFQRLFGRNVLVVAQVAISMLLVVAASLMYRGFMRLLSGDTGFRTSNLVMMSFDPTLLRYSRPQIEQFYKVLTQRAAATPGVKSVALSATVPFGASQDGVDIAPEGFQFAPGKETAPVFRLTVGDGYFRTMQIPILQGREILDSDQPNSPEVAVVNQALADRFFPNQNPIGKRIHLNKATGPMVEIVGVAKTSKYLWVGESPSPAIYLPFGQHQAPRMTLLAETTADSASLVAPLREVVRSIDANLPVYDVRTMENFYQLRAIGTVRLIVQTVSAMGCIGLALAMVGLYGLVAFTVARRTREIGIRMAIGADRRNVLRMVLRQGAVLSVIGVAIGWAGSFGVARILTAALNVPSLDPLVLTILPAALIVVTTMAALGPALRASRIDPLRALRWE